MKTFIAPTKDVYQIITDKIIERLEQGFIPWKKPWNNFGPACNYISMKPYRGINAILLNFAPYQKPYFLTFKQASDLGGRVKKGAKAEIVTYWNFIYINKETGEKISFERAKLLPAQQVQKSGFLKYYNVFNVSDVEGIDFKFPEQIVNSQEDRLDECENIINNYFNKPIFEFGGTEAYYSSSADYIQIPDFKCFESKEFYYSIFFHEMIHSTGHQSRLNRKEIVERPSFGNDLYSKEELTAELGASFLCGKTQILQSTFENSSAYIQNWLIVFKNDKKFIIEAAGKAQQAIDYILNNPEEIEELKEEQEKHLV